VGSSRVARALGWVCFGGLASGCYSSVIVATRDVPALARGEGVRAIDGADDVRLADASEIEPETERGKVLVVRQGNVVATPEPLPGDGNVTLKAPFSIEVRAPLLVLSGKEGTVGVDSNLMTGLRVERYSSGGTAVAVIIPTVVLGAIAGVVIGAFASVNTSNFP
jgi:hypothetical protein